MMTYIGEGTTIVYEWGRATKRKLVVNGNFLPSLMVYFHDKQNLLGTSLSHLENKLIQQYDYSIFKE